MRTGLGANPPLREACSIIEGEEDDDEGKEREDEEEHKEGLISTCMLA